MKKEPAIYWAIQGMSNAEKHSFIKNKNKNATKYSICVAIIDSYSIFCKVTGSTMNYALIPRLINPLEELPLEDIMFTMRPGGFRSRRKRRIIYLRGLAITKRQYLFFLPGIVLKYSKRPLREPIHCFDRSRGRKP